jgi:hypothetical protein
MKRRRLIETVEAQIIMTTMNTNDVMFQGMCSEWSGLPYAELSVLLAQLRALHCVHHTHHWQALGDSFYGDHLLFGRLYEGVAGEIDTMGEKAVGLGCVENVKLDLQMSQVMQFIAASKASPTQAIPQKDDLAKCSMMCELDFLKNCALASQMLEQSGLLTGGVDNMLQGLEDVHEGYVYLLKQRVTLTNVINSSAIPF